MASHQSQRGHTDALRTAVAIVRALVAMNPRVKGVHGALEDAHRRIDAFADSLQQCDQYRDRTSAHECRVAAEETRGGIISRKGRQEEPRSSTSEGGSVSIEDSASSPTDTQTPTAESSPMTSIPNFSPSPERITDIPKPPATTRVTHEGSGDDESPSLLLEERRVSDDDVAPKPTAVQTPDSSAIIPSPFPSAKKVVDTKTSPTKRTANHRLPPSSLRRSRRFPERNPNNQTTTQTTNGSSPTLLSKSKSKPPASSRRISSVTDPFTILWRDMGEALVPRLNKFFKKPNFSGKVTVSGIPKFDWAAMGENVPPDENGNRDYVAVSYRRGQKTQRGPYVTLRPVAKRGKRGRELRWPDFPIDGEVRRLTTKEMEDFLEDLVMNPPAEPIPYYGGQPPPELCGALCAGEVFRSEQAIRFVSTPYLHAGYPRSATAMHVENAHWRSSNLTFRGAKIWLLVNTRDTAKLEQLVRDNWPHTECHDFVRHVNIMMAPSWLTQAGIRFDLFCALPGDLVLTEPYQYHYCVNYTACLAVSINFLLPHENFMPESLAVCKGCGPYGLQEEYDCVKVVSTTLHEPAVPEERPPKGLKKKAGRKPAPAAEERSSKRVRTLRDRA